MKITRDIYPNKDYWDDDFELQVMCDNLEIEPGMRILDLGCLDSYIDDVIQGLGCESWGVDIRYYHDAKFKYIQQDFLKIPSIKLPENYFDIIIDISAIHHFGIGYLDELPESERIIDIDADIKASEKVYKLLKPNGLFYVSTDAFKDKYKTMENLGRQHNLNSFINRIGKCFKIIDTKFYISNLYPLTIYESKEEAEVKGAQLYIKMQK